MSSLAANARKKRRRPPALLFMGSRAVSRCECIPTKDVDPLNDSGGRRVFCARSHCELPCEFLTTLG